MGDLITTTWLWVNLVILLAAFVMSITGFGFALVTASLLLFLVDPKTVIVFNVFLGTIVCLPILWQTRKFLRPRRIAVLIISSTLALPLGIYALAQFSSPMLRLIIITMVVIFTILLALGISFKVKEENLGCAVSGFISGALSNSTGLGGPPIILFLLNQEWAKDVFRGNITAYFVLNGIAAAISLGVSGNLSSDIVVYTLTTIPALAIGYYLGTLLLPHINAISFRKIAIYVLLGCSLLGIIDEVITYLV